MIAQAKGGPGGAGPYVLRGGSWNNNASNARAANRNNNTPDNRNNNNGFRVVLPAKNLGKAKMPHPYLGGG